MTIRTPILTAALCALTACGGISYAMNTYSGIKPQDFTTATGTWRAFDKADAGLLMITPTPGRAAASGATFGAAGGLMQVAPYRVAAIAYLAGRGECTLSDGRKVLEWQYEFEYSC